MIQADSLPSLKALQAEYESQVMKADYLCHQLKVLTETFKDCFITPEEGDHPEKDLTDRLLRHYVSEGLVSPPDKEKGENRFGFQHVMELLALRKLQSERTLTLIGMRDLVKSCSPERLYHILTRGMRLRIEPKDESGSEPRGNFEALQAIEKIERETRRASRPPKDTPEPLSGTVSQWKAHHTLDNGLEVVFSEAFQGPATLHEEHLLVDEFRKCLRERRRHRSDR